MATGTLAKQENRGRQNRTERFGLAPFEEEVRQLVSRVFGDEGRGFGQGGGLASIDVSETDKQIEVRLDLPGMDAKEIDIQVSDNVLTVSGERKAEKEEKGKHFHRVERRCGSFSRSVTLPTAVKQEEVDAQYHDGVLTILLPKSEAAKARKITVKT